MNPPRRRRYWRWALLVPLLTYAMVVFGMWSIENSLVFQPSSAEELWVAPPNEKFQELTLPVPTDLPIAGCDVVHAWWLPGTRADRAILVCHGNAGNLSTRGPTIAQFSKALDRSILIFDYPGYGKTPGESNEAKCYQAARIAHRWLTGQGIAADHIVLYGESLGGGVATQLATEFPHDGLVLMKSFTTLPDTAHVHYPWLPVRWLMCNRFDSLSKMEKVKGPVFVVGATADRVIPFVQSERLFAAAPEPKQMRRLEGDDHGSPLPSDFLPEMRQFLDAHEK